jgi:hypothetical protein
MPMLPRSRALAPPAVLTHRREEIPLRATSARSARRELYLQASSIARNAPARSPFSLSWFERLLRLLARSDSKAAGCAWCETAKRSDSRRLAILTAREIDEQYGLPRFTDEDRCIYFRFEPGRTRRR